jgi:hypothetical protein
MFTDNCGPKPVSYVHAMDDSSNRLTHTWVILAIHRGRLATPNDIPMKADHHQATPTIALVRYGSMYVSIYVNTYTYSIYILYICVYVCMCVCVCVCVSM